MVTKGRKQRTRREPLFYIEPRRAVPRMDWPDSVGRYDGSDHSYGDPPEYFDVGSATPADSAKTWTARIEDRDELPMTGAVRGTASAPGPVKEGKGPLRAALDVAMGAMRWAPFGDRKAPEVAPMPRATEAEDGVRFGSPRSVYPTAPGGLATAGKGVTPVKEEEEETAVDEALDSLLGSMEASKPVVAKNGGIMLPLASPSPSPKEKAAVTPAETAGERGASPLPSAPPAPDHAAATEMTLESAVRAFLEAHPEAEYFFPDDNFEEKQGSVKGQPTYPLINRDPWNSKPIRDKTKIQKWPTSVNFFVSELVKFAQENQRPEDKGYAAKESLVKNFKNVLLGYLRTRLTNYSASQWQRGVLTKIITDFEKDFNQRAVDLCYQRHLLRQRLLLAQRRFAQRRVGTR